MCRLAFHHVQRDMLLVCGKACFVKKHNRKRVFSGRRWFVIQCAIPVYLAAPFRHGFMVDGVVFVRDMENYCQRARHIDIDGHRPGFPGGNLAVFQLQLGHLRAHLADVQRVRNAVMPIRQHQVIYALIDWLHGVVHAIPHKLVLALL